MIKTYILVLFIAIGLMSCQKDNKKEVQNNKTIDSGLLKLQEVGSTDLGGFGASEISAFDPSTQKLFVVDNQDTKAPKITVLDLSDPSNLKTIESFDLKTHGAANSVAIYDGVLAIATQAPVKTDAGSVILLKTSDLTLIKKITVGVLPDMVTFSYDGQWILTANEGEPNDNYSIDPKGSISIINAKHHDVTTLDFSQFESQKAELLKKGMRVSGPGASLSQDIEPEYIAISKDSKKAYVSLQENNAILEVDITNKKLVNIYPMGLKDFSQKGNELDPSDKDGKVKFRNAPVKGFYQPDALATFTVNGATYIITANEGDPREYEGFVEEKRVGELTLDEATFKDAINLKKDEKLGRLNVSAVDGDTDGDGDHDQLIAFGARSFSIWDANGNMVYDCGSLLEQKINEAGLYPEKKSDNKGVEPEGVTTAEINGRVYAFLVVEKANAMAVIEVTNPNAPNILSITKTGEAPEGVLFVPKDKSPNQKALVIVCSEKDGKVTVYAID